MSLTVGEFVALAGLIFTIGSAIIGLLLRAESRMKRVETIIQSELTRNGGTSLKDRVVHIEQRLWSLEHNLTSNAEAR